MLERLRRHPFAVRAHFDRVLVLTWAAEADALAPLLPPRLRLDTWRGLGFVALALVQTRALRFDGWPAWTGQDFFQSGYRLFTRFRTPGGRSLRGLRILRNDADARRMVVAGNLMTHYRYHAARVTSTADAQHFHIKVASSDGRADLDVTARLDESGHALPDGSPFDTVAQARRFAGPLPFTFDYEPETRSVIAIRGERLHWNPRAVPVELRACSFFDAWKLPRVRLASAFYIENVPYRWHAGTLYPPENVPAAPPSQKEVHAWYTA